MDTITPTSHTLLHLQSSSSPPPSLSSSPLYADFSPQNEFLLRSIVVFGRTFGFITRSHTHSPSLAFLGPFRAFFCVVPPTSRMVTERTQVLHRDGHTVLQTDRPTKLTSAHYLVQSGTSYRPQPSSICTHTLIIVSLSFFWTAKLKVPIMAILSHRSRHFNVSQSILCSHTHFQKIWASAFRVELLDTFAAKAGQKKPALFLHDHSDILSRSHF